MLATNMAVEAALRPDLDDAVATAHFGALRGRNDYEDCAAGLVLGRNQPPAATMEDVARALWSADPEPLDLPGAYRKTTRGIRMRDGSAVPVEVDAHPDPRVQRVLELHRERESEQALDRLRLVHRCQRRPGHPDGLRSAAGLPADCRALPNGRCAGAQLRWNSPGATQDPLKGHSAGGWAGKGRWRWAPRPRPGRSGCAATPTNDWWPSSRKRRTRPGPCARGWLRANLHTLFGLGLSDGFVRSVLGGEAAFTFGPTPRPRLRRARPHGIVGGATGRVVDVSRAVQEVEP